MSFDLKQSFNVLGFFHSPCTTEHLHICRFCPRRIYRQLSANTCPVTYVLTDGHPSSLARGSSRTLFSFAENLVNSYWNLLAFIFLRVIFKHSLFYIKRLLFHLYSSLLVYVLGYLLADTAGPNKRNIHLRSYMFLTHSAEWGHASWASL